MRYDPLKTLREVEAELTAARRALTRLTSPLPSPDWLAAHKALCAMASAEGRLCAAIGIMTERKEI